MSDYLGRFFASLMPVLLMFVMVVVIGRYFFGIGRVDVQELALYLHALIFLGCAGWAYSADEHVRVDIFYRQLNPTHRAWINLIGVIIFLFPLCFFIGWKAYDFVAISWRIQEASRESGGLPYPMIPLLKSILMIMPITVSLQGIAMILDCIRTIRKD